MANKEPQTERDKAFASMMPGELDAGKVIETVLDLTAGNAALVDKLTRQRHMLLRFAEEFIEWADLQSNYSISEVHNIDILIDMAEKAIECCDE